MTQEDTAGVDVSRWSQQEWANSVFESTALQRWVLKLNLAVFLKHDLTVQNKRASFNNACEASAAANDFDFSSKVAW